MTDEQKKEMQAFLSICLSPIEKVFGADYNYTLIITSKIDPETTLTLTTVQPEGPVV